ncbi:MAG TPA: hypothetical protein PKI46_07315, partial [Bacteroidales bacterium]|nr:hypothetical protein [Bacteroidales bacterium]
NILNIIFNILQKYSKEPKQIKRIKEISYNDAKLLDNYNKQNIIITQDDIKNFTKEDFDKIIDTNLITINGIVYDGLKDENATYIDNFLLKKLFSNLYNIPIIPVQSNTQLNIYEITKYLDNDEVKNKYNEIDSILKKYYDVKDIEAPQAPSGLTYASESINYEPKLEGTVYAEDNVKITKFSEIFTTLYDKYKNKEILKVKPSELKEFYKTIIEKNIKYEDVYNYFDFIIKFTAGISDNFKFNLQKIDYNVFRIQVYSGKNSMYRDLDFENNIIIHQLQEHKDKINLKHFGAQATLAEQQYHYKKLFENSDKQLTIQTNPGLSLGDLTWSKLGFNRKVEPSNYEAIKKITDNLDNTFDVLSKWNITTDLKINNIIFKNINDQQTTDAKNTFYVNDEISDYINQNKIDTLDENNQKKIVFIQELINNIETKDSLTEIYNIGNIDFKQLSNIKFDFTKDNTTYKTVPEFICYGLNIVGSGDATFDARANDTNSNKSLLASIIKN